MCAIANFMYQEFDVHSSSVVNSCVKSLPGYQVMGLPSYLLDVFCVTNLITSGPHHVVMTDYAAGTP
ncbi:Uncharacterised protein [Enterobacter kobei]|nr:Uncharacterised protein [Enterobacter kobei]